MADDWKVVSQTPVGTPPPTSQAAEAGSSPDQWKVVSQTPAKPATPEMVSDAIRQHRTTMAEDMSPAAGVERIKGIGQGAAHTVAGLLDMFGRAGGGGVVPGVVPGTGNAGKLGDWIRSKTPATNKYQHQGQVSESILELLATPEMTVEKLPFLTEFFTEGAKLTKLLNTHAGRVVAKAAAGAGRGAAEQGAQTYLKSGGDPKETTSSTVGGGVIGGVMGAAGGVYQEARQALSDLALSKTAPPPRPIRNEQFTTTREGNLLKPANELADTTTAQAESVVKDIGQTAVRNSLKRANAARPRPDPRIVSSTRMLEAPEGSAQGFRVGTTPPAEVGEPPQVDTRTVQAGSRTVPNPDFEAPAGTLTREPGQTVDQAAEEIGTQAGTVPPRVITGPEPVDTRNPTQRRLDAAQGRVPERMITGDQPPTVEEPVFQQQPVVTREGTQQLGGGGDFILTADGKRTSVEKARALHQHMESVLEDPAQMAEIGPRQQQLMEEQHADLTEQLRRYDDYQASQPNFPKHDENAIAQNVTGIQNAGQTLKNIHSKFWQRADELTNGEFSLLTKQAKGLAKSIRTPNMTTTDRLARLDDLSEVNDKIEAMFDKYRTSFKPEEWKAARDGYMDGAALDELGQFFEAHMGGVTAAEAARNPALARSRKFEPGDNYLKGLQKIFDKRPAAFQRTIGTQGMDNMKELGQLFQNPETAEATKKLSSYIWQSIKAHSRGAHGITSEAGGGLALAMGHYGAAAAGLSAPAVIGTVAGGKRYIADRIASDPEFAKRFIYAVKNNIAPRVSATLLASWLLHPMKKGPAAQPTIEDKTVVPADQSRGVKPVTLPVLEGAK